MSTFMLTCRKSHEQHLLFSRQWQCLFLLCVKEKQRLAVEMKCFCIIIISFCILNKTIQRHVLNAFNACIFKKVYVLN